MSTIKISTENLNACRAALYYQYDSQNNLQPAHIELESDGNVSAVVNYEIGSAIPFSVWHGVDTRIQVSPSIDCAELSEYLNSTDFLALATRYYAGHTEVWDGNNHVGRLTDDARAALYDIERALDQLPEVEIWDVSDWINGGMSVSELLECGSVAALSARYDEGKNNDQYVVGDIADAICDWVEARADEDDAEDVAALALVAAHRAA